MLSIIETEMLAEFNKPWTKLFPRQLRPDVASPTSLATGCAALVRFEILVADRIAILRIESSRWLALFLLSVHLMLIVSRRPVPNFGPNRNAKRAGRELVAIAS